MGFGANGLGHIAFPYVYLDATYIKASMRALTDGRDPEAERSADYRMERPSSGNTIFNAASALLAYPLVDEALRGSRPVHVTRTIGAAGSGGSPPVRSGLDHGSVETRLAQCPPVVSVTMGSPAWKRPSAPLPTLENLWVTIG